MAEPMSVRCPSCRRAQVFTPPSYPCPCGAALSVPLLRGGVPVRITQRAANDSWVRMYCPRCGASDEWPKPEFTCACGATVRLPVDTSSRMRRVPPPSVPAPPPSPLPTVLPPVHRGAPAVRGGRPPFRPLPIRTAQDALHTALRYLLWLGRTGVHLTAPSARRDNVAIAGPGIAAQVESWAMPTELRAVELLWLHTLHQNVAGAFFSLAGYVPEAVERGEQLSIALFVFDDDGAPRAVNRTAREFLG